MDDMKLNQVPENQTLNEFDPAFDNAALAEATAQDDYTAYQEATFEEQAQPASRINKQKKNQALSALSGGMVTVIAAVAVGITSMMNVNMSAKFDKVEYVDGGIQCDVSVTDMTENEKLTAYLYENGKIVTAIELTDDDDDGIISQSIPLDTNAIAEKLASGKDISVAYRVTLKGMVGLNVERSFDSYVVEINKVSSSFESITGECHCAEDGCYHFKLNFTDNLNKFDNFTAKIEDSFGNVAVHTFSEDLHEVQKLNINHLQGSVAKLTVTFTADGELQTYEINIEI